jgi:2',3'-cyclic-nucleotide 2'-phosphodiesterase/3'-nucleotidase
VIKLALNYTNGTWAMDRNSSTAQARSIQNADNSYVAVDPAISQAIAAEHSATSASRRWRRPAR